MDKFINQVIEKLEAIDRTGAFHEDSVVAIFTLIRQHLELNNLKSQYTIAAFYCDWCLHVMLDRNLAIKGFFQQLDSIISIDGEISLNDKINKSISIQRLRNELIQILGQVGVRSKILNSRAGWKAFLSVLLKSLIDKPLKRTSGANTKRYATEFALQVPDTSKIDKDYLAELGKNEGVVFWKIFVQPTGRTLTGPLVLAEDSDKFRSG